jgi:hypothetical protein
MNRIILFMFAFLLVNISFAQSKFDNKPYVEGEMLVQMEPNVNIYDVIKKYPIHLGLEVVEELSAPMRVWLVKYDQQVSSAITIQQLLYDDAQITLSEYNYYVEMRETVPNDTQLGQQWHHVNTGQTGGTADADIDSDLAWDITTGGTTATNDDIVVCIIEGANLDHDDLRANRWINPGEIAGNGIDDDGNGYIDDIMGWNPGGNNGTVGYGTNSGATSHGTSCVGMFAAVGDNNLGVAGANWNLKVMVVTVGNLTQANVISSYTYPLVQRQRWNNSNGAQGALVVATSASWGIDNANPDNYPLWCNFYDTLGYYGIINIGATTNNNTNVDVSGDMPTACSSPYMVGVGRTDHNDNTAGGYGVTTIDFGAPGINVRTTANSNGYTTTTGTSFACPLTAGVVGLAYAIPCESFINFVKSDPRGGADLVLQALLEGVDQKSQLATRFITGGRLNARNTLDSLMSYSCNLSNCSTPNGVALANVSGNSASLSWNANNEADNFVLNYREVGAATWTEEIVAGTSFAFSGLTECTAYEFYLSAECGEEASSNTTIYSFTTQGCGACLDLVYCAGASTDANQNLFTVTRPAAIADNYTFQAPSVWGANLQNTYAAGEMVLVSDGTAADSLGCNSLVNGVDVSGKIAVVYRGTCEFGNKALNAQNAGAIGVIVINNAAGTMDMAAGTNGPSVTIPVAMISNTNGAILKAQLDAGQTVRGILGTKRDWINTVSVGTFNHTSGNDNGYAHHVSAGTIELNQDTDHPFVFSPGYQTQAYETQFRAWVDFDLSGDFDDTELVYAQSEPGYGSVSGTFNVPASAPLGSTRMRVVMSYVGPGQTALPSSCTQFSFGEVEDFCVEIMENAGTNSVAEIGDANIKLFPNPAKDILTISNASDLTVVIEIMDLTGRVVESSQMNPGMNQLHVDRLATGTFIYRLTSLNGEVVKTGKLQIAR